MHLEMDSVNSEKFFMQRLCTDLKMALRSYVSQNKVLKEQLNGFSKEKQDFSSLPNIMLELPTSNKYDEAYINQLLQQNKAPIKDKPLIEIKGSLDVLRQEISTLQEEIIKKNVPIFIDLARALATSL
ncbi:hypothetical protein NQ317_002922 [Molorchus minor]|uniref:Uncharacterized protein n=1 Tax=Molorchus minor TaxID=1323400 RepID=A0ABQ9J6P1_9CUCU|nr:hypothetical protein NQ317_002922 [Molorchus minor]